MRVVRTPTGVAFELQTGFGGLGPSKLVEFFRYEIDGSGDSAEPSLKGLEDLYLSHLAALQDLLASEQLNVEHKRIVLQTLLDQMLYVLPDGHESASASEDRASDA